MKNTLIHNLILNNVYLLPLCPRNLFKNLGLLLAVLIALISAGKCFAFDYQEDFSTYQEGSLVGQNSWKPYLANTGDKSEPIVSKDATSGALYLEGNPDGGSVVVRQSENSCGEERVTIVLRCRIGTMCERNEVSLGIGSGKRASAHISLVGTKNQKATIGVRLPAWGDASLGFLKNGKMASLSPGEIYEVKSTWDIPSATATLEYRNISNEEQDFTPLYSDKAGTQRNFSLGEDPPFTQWKSFFIRLGGDSSDQILGFSISPANANE